jgi:hypothetical protein
MGDRSPAAVGAGDIGAAAAGTTQEEGRDHTWALEVSPAKTRHASPAGAELMQDCMLCLYDDGSTGLTCGECTE